MSTVEFWPDYGPGPLWSKDGEAIDPASLGVSADLAARLGTWNGLYAESKVPLDGPGDADWLAEGKRLLAELRDEVGDQCDVAVTEPWWGEQPS